MKGREETSKSKSALIQLGFIQASSRYLGKPSIVRQSRVAEGEGPRMYAHTARTQVSQKNVIVYTIFYMIIRIKNCIS
jgi:hypothetical protein